MQLSASLQAPAIDGFFLIWFHTRPPVLICQKKERAY